MPPNILKLVPFRKKGFTTKTYLKNIRCDQYRKSLADAGCQSDARNKTAASIDAVILRDEMLFDEDVYSAVFMWSFSVAHISAVHRRRF